MKTFDLALKHLKDFDSFTLPLFVSKENEIAEFILDNPAIFDKVQAVLKNYLNDPRNTESNDYWKCVVMETAMRHKIFIAHEVESFFDVAKQIIEKYKHVLDSKEYGYYKNTVYPEVMLNEWIDYCDLLKTKTAILEGELRDEFFFTAFHFYTD